MVEEREYVSNCPVCGMNFVAMSPDEYREKHTDNCDGAPYTKLIVFPKK